MTKLMFVIRGRIGRGLRARICVGAWSDRAVGLARRIYALGGRKPSRTIRVLACQVVILIPDALWRVSQSHQRPIEPIPSDILSG
ncbi:unnamed protein product [Parascedosporium putredinis]|uniref:Uncharacterized protein n=1 Tax=Parascedosporium putredinis TaxID=1442378 RepID=A0A9P1GXM9_9PEZI|nr:unnamed protein product [Parascedosporium putredinis]CAI7989367.1 unnamed protein product [Parascedosporium putredinis]